MIARWAVWVFACLNVLLYASVLPLWEGFDEPLHYGYVQYLWTQRQLLVTGKAELSEEVWQSLHVVPGSYLVKRNLPFVETFEDWFRRGGPRVQVDGGDKYKLAPGALNYEAQQAPLAYAVMAVPDIALSRVSLPVRVWLLRVVCGGVGVALFLSALMRLTSSPAAWFCALCVQMLYATVVHVSNDWLAVGIAAWFFVACVERRPWVCSVLLAAGLLTKAYFLAFVPIGVWVCRRKPVAVVALLAAVPWYVRNLALYGNVAGTFIATPKMTMGDAASSIDWLHWIDYIVHAGLWTGNNSFTTFSRLTLDVLVVALVVGLAFSRRSVRWELVAGIGAMAAVLVYSTVMLRAYSGGETVGTGPWYIPAIYVPVFALAFARVPRWLGCFAVVLSAYIIVATYWLKLIPMYAGFVGRGTIGALYGWYTGGQHMPAYLASSGIVYALASSVTVTAIFIVLRVGTTPASLGSNRNPAVDTRHRRSPTSLE